jgi:hypothetical protein
MGMGYLSTLASPAGVVIGKGQSDIKMPSSIDPAPANAAFWLEVPAALSAGTVPLFPDFIPNFRPKCAPATHL